MFFKCSAISHFRQTCPDATALLVILHSRFLDISSRFLHDAQHSLTTIPYWFLVKFASIIIFAIPLFKSLF